MFLDNPPFNQRVVFVDNEIWKVDATISDIHQRNAVEAESHIFYVVWLLQSQCKNGDHAFHVISC